MRRTRATSTAWRRERRVRRIRRGRTPARWPGRHHCRRDRSPARWRSCPWREDDVELVGSYTRAFMVEPVAIHHTVEGRRFERVDQQQRTSWLECGDGIHDRLERLLAALVIGPHIEDSRFHWTTPARACST